MLHVLYGLFFILASPAEKDVLFFCDIHVKNAGSMVVVETQLQELELHIQAEDSHRDLIHGLRKMSLDGPVREGVAYLRTLDQQRNVLFPKGMKEPFAALTYPFSLTTRRIAGEPIDSFEYEVFLYLDTKPGFAVLEREGVRTEIELASLNNKKTYQKFFRRFLAPAEVKPLKHGDGPFLVDLNYYWPKQMKLPISPVPDTIYQSPIFVAEKVPLNLSVHLGTTFCRSTDSGLKQVRSDHLHFQNEITNQYQEILALKEDEKNEDFVTALEGYITTVPTDQLALKNLVKAYLNRDQMGKASRLIENYRPFLEIDDQEKAWVANIEEKHRAYREALLSKRMTFSEDPTIGVQILSPNAGDAIGGNGFLRYELEAGDRRFLAAEIRLGQMVIGRSDSLDGFISYSVPRRRGDNHISVSFYFEDETRVVKTLPVELLPIDTQDMVNLSRLRAVVTKGEGKFLTDLEEKHFSVNVNGSQTTIREFKRDQSPLRVAILLDTSASMKGEKLFQAQFAVKEFLEQLGPEDKACIYTFDRHVLKLSGFTNDFSEVIPRLFTMSPMSLTTLYDAVFVAHQELIEMEGNKVMVIVSDGGDRLSRVDTQQINDMMSRSPVMVYSVMLDELPGISNDGPGKQFLRNLSAMTGSVATDLEHPRFLRKTFRQIYRELRSFYYMEIDDSQLEPNLANIEMNIKKRGARPRFRYLYQ